MSIHRSYAVALGLVIIAAVVALATSSHSSSKSKALTKQQIAALEASTLQRVKFPSDFVRVERGCSRGRCYIVNTSPSHVVATVPALLRSAGFQPVGSLRAAEPIALLKKAHWTTTNADPLTIACRTQYTVNHTPETECQDAGRIGQTLVNVLVGPYHLCDSRSCAGQPSKTGVLAWAVTIPNS